MYSKIHTKKYYFHNYMINCIHHKFQKNITYKLFSRRTYYMKFFIDTANVEKIKKVNDMGIICGVTTKPSLIAKEGRDFKEVIKKNHINC